MIKSINLLRLQNKVQIKYNINFEFNIYLLIL